MNFGNLIYAGYRRRVLSFLLDFVVSLEDRDDFGPVSVVYTASGGDGVMSIISSGTGYVTEKDCRFFDCVFMALPYLGLTYMVKFSSPHRCICR